MSRQLHQSTGGGDRPYESTVSSSELSQMLDDLFLYASDYGKFSPFQQKAFQNNILKLVDTMLELGILDESDEEKLYGLPAINDGDGVKGYLAKLRQKLEKYNECATSDLPLIMEHKDMIKRAVMISQYGRIDGDNPESTELDDVLGKIAESMPSREDLRGAARKASTQPK